MHFVFWINGMRHDCETFLRHTEHVTCALPFENPGLNPALKDGNGNILARGVMPTNIGIRTGIFGTYEAIFPENEKNKVLTYFKRFSSIHSFTSEVKNDNNWKNDLLNAKTKAKITTFRKMLGLEKLPEVEEDNSILYPSDKPRVRIIPIGVRYDTTATFENGLTHEGL